MKIPFVLMRIHNPAVAGLEEISRVINTNWSGIHNAKGLIEKNFYNKLETALLSVQQNRAKLIICDDTPRINSWNKHNQYLSSILEKYGFTQNENNVFFCHSNGGEGSALALWRLRKQFLEVTAHMDKDEPFAILLDQDDELCSNAVKRIQSKMSKHAIVVSNYRMQDSNNLNIVRDGGKMHRHALITAQYCPFSLPRLSSIGWTKAYSKEAIQTMVSDFDSYFKQSEFGSCETFFRKHPAYEDFLDFYMLLHKNIKIRTNHNYSHIYHKHVSSITANPSLEAFTQTRPIMLYTLSKMCICSRQLKTYWSKLLVNFLTIKMTDIENILQKYRNEAEQGMLSLKQFKENTSPGFFIRLMESDFHNEYILEAAKKFWNAPQKQNRTSERNRKTDIQKKHAITPKDIYIWGFIALVILIFLLIIEINLPKNWLESDFIDPDTNEIVFINLLKSWLESLKNLLSGIRIKENFNTEVFSILITLLTAVGSIFYERVTNLKNKIEEEKSMRKIFFSEFKDMVRHLEANLRVLIQLRIELTRTKNNGRRPASIHFENLKLPTDSTIFSNKILLLIDRDIVDDITRMQINLRNMNNSAEWLKNLADKNKYSTSDMRTILDWEIYRIMAYFVHALYMENNHYHFATELQLDEYLTSREIQDRLSSLFMDIPEKAKRRMVALYIEMYYKDRRLKRKINLMGNKIF